MVDKIEIGSNARLAWCNYFPIQKVLVGNSSVLWKN